MCLPSPDFVFLLSASDDAVLFNTFFLVCGLCGIISSLVSWSALGGSGRPSPGTLSIHAATCTGVHEGIALCFDRGIERLNY